jgi:hypothetical protein
MALVVVACWATLCLPASPVRADVLVTIYSGNPGGAGNGGPNLDFTGLSQLGSFPYYGIAFGVDSQAGGGNPNGDWNPLYRATNYSASITGQFSVATTGTYTFSTRSDDGSVLRIDGNPVVNNNFFQGPTTRTGTATLAAGVHNFEVQFFQGGGGKSLDVGLPAGVSILNHQNVPQLLTTVYNGQRFDFTTGAVVNPNVPVAGTFLTPAINFDYGTGSRWSPFGLTDNFSDSTTGFLLVNAPGTYRFGLNSDDGSFLFIDGALVINNGFFQGSNQTPPFGQPQVTADIFLGAGIHRIEVDHFQGGGGAGVTLFLPDFFGQGGVSFATPLDLVPEPSSIALFAVGLSGCAAYGWRRRRKVEEAAGAHPLTLPSPPRGRG